MITRVIAFTTLWIALACSVWGACKPPDEKTTPAPIPKELTVQDPKGRDFEFYDKSYALIIGQSAYLHRNKLSMVKSEMQKLKSVLESHGFEVSTYYDLDSEQLQPVIECFVRNLADESNSRVVIFFSGHGETKTIKAAILILNFKASQNFIIVWDEEQCLR